MYLQWLQWMVNDISVLGLVIAGQTFSTGSSHAAGGEIQPSSSPGDQAESSSHLMCVLRELFRLVPLQPQGLASKGWAEVVSLI